MSNVTKEKWTVDFTLNKLAACGLKLEAKEETFN
jgi:hypothetical protein